MTSPKLDNNCELVFENGICGIVSDSEDLIQAIRVELEQNKGQFALNVSWGTPYLNSKNMGILQIKNNKERIIQEYIRVIKKYDGVEKIEKIEFVYGKLVVEVMIDGEVYSI